MFNVFSISRPVGLARFYAVLALGFFSNFGIAGPVIIAGTDADDHGSATASANLDGWLFMQRAFEATAGAVTNSQKRLVCLGCNSGVAVTAFNSAFDKSSLPGLGWSRFSLSSSADIASFFAGTGTTSVTNTGVVYLPSDSANVSGGITAAQLALVASDARALATFVASGGGLFTQTHSGTTGGYAWLTALLPQLQSSVAGIVPATGLIEAPSLTAQFPSLSGAAIAGASQWHSYFEGPTGGLSVLATGEVTATPTNVQRPVILGNVVLRNFSGTEIVPTLNEWFTTALALLLTAIALVAKARLSLRRASSRKSSR